MKGRSWPRHVMAAAGFLAAALWALRTILPSPATVFAIGADATALWQPIIQADQKLSAANVTWNAHRFLTAPWALYQPGQCYPAANAATLGPHQLSEGLLGVVPYALTRDPVLTYNAVLFLTLWVPALAMYALVTVLTGSASAGFVAGLLFALHPQRIQDMAHPDVHGNYWAPLGLLFMGFAVLRGRWRDAAGLLLFVVLQVMGSIYQLLAFVVLGGTYAVFLLVHARRRIATVASRLAFVAAGSGVAAWLVLGPYLHTRAAWGALSGRQSIFYSIADFGFGGRAYPGSVLVLLAMIGLVDRVRGPRHGTGHDGRVALLVATVMVVWASVYDVPLLGITIPSLFTLAARVLPGLDAIRAGAVIGFGVMVTGAALAGYGAAALVAARGVAMRATLTAVLTVAILVEIFVPAVAVRSFGSTAELKMYTVRPPDAVVDVYRNSGTGAVLDVPYSFDLGVFTQMVEGDFLSAFHLRPVAACYNSFQLPLHEDVTTLSKRIVTDAAAADELAALGFDAVVVNRLHRGTPFAFRFDADIPWLVRGPQAASRSAFALRSTAPVTTSFDALMPGAGGTAVPAPAASNTPVTFTFRNAAAATFRHPDPIEPARVTLRWHRDGVVERQDDARLLLPIALAAGRETVRKPTVAIPSQEGTYEVTLARADAPDHVLARAAVTVGAQP